ncbi:hypothetical protein HO133_005800 [Letharia lupina]|uniref:Sulfhydryl oxidase n=1 Tax=Letharia lupina TaxID=560253 RepID=A0A8H6F832_9LECA|nr:uncharacterized protein HO133_005800 [Letharia lupina]KAF6218451.1 hypothetical protein HO133_005800 [Letharia lupina]
MDKFFNGIQKTNQKPTADPEDPTAPEKKAIPKGVVLGKDGKPCRSCTSFSSWAAMTRKDTTPAATTDPPAPPTSPPSPPPDCPPDVDALGRSTWTFLHALSAAYPPAATAAQQAEMRQFLALFARLYPCWPCAEDFRAWMGRGGNAPRVEGREGLGRWMCEAHNEVNRKLGKREFECARWEERWRTGGGMGGVVE